MHLAPMTVQATRVPCQAGVLGACAGALCADVVCARLRAASPQPGTLSPSAPGNASLATSFNAEMAVFAAGVLHRDIYPRNDLVAGPLQASSSFDKGDAALLLLTCWCPAHWQYRRRMAALTSLARRRSTDHFCGSRVLVMPPALSLALEMVSVGRCRL
jgi:hypothetical protein